MDICWSRTSAYEVTNRTKGPFVRPVTTTSAATVNHPFNKVAGVHAQVGEQNKPPDPSPCFALVYLPLCRLIM